MIFGQAEVIRPLLRSKPIFCNSGHFWTLETYCPTQNMITIKFPYQKWLNLSYRGQKNEEISSGGCPITQMFMSIMASPLACKDLSWGYLNPPSVISHRGQRTDLAVTPQIRGCLITLRFLSLQTSPLAWKDLSWGYSNPPSVISHRGQRTDLAVTPQIRGCLITQRFMSLQTSPLACKDLSWV